MPEVAEKRNPKHARKRKNLHVRDPKNVNGAKAKKVSPERRDPATPKSVANAADAALNQRGQRSVAAAGLYTPVKVNANLVM